MTDRAAIRAGTVGAILAAICCAGPLLALALPLAGLGAWLAGAGLVVLSMMIAGLGLAAWGVHRRRAKAAGFETKFHREVVKP